MSNRNTAPPARPGDDTRTRLDEDILDEEEPNGEVEIEVDPEEREDRQLRNQNEADETEERHSHRRG